MEEFMQVPEGVRVGQVEYLLDERISEEMDAIKDAVKAAKGGGKWESIEKA